MGIRGRRETRGTRGTRETRRIHNSQLIPTSNFFPRIPRHDSLFPTLCSLLPAP
ncbi:MULTISPECIES: hypothetical protein [Chroococcidiopsis]|uniref:hypothetical protein n=1 Tax=Chroococcidiopsis TaxID=54298 RepID=UPI0015F03508|nr:MULTISPECIES: hypothetical protein [Chroococcidiopsis]URD52675.1 hypothetical protein M5J74_11910 [Chroococcidiopsis sp. CCNUC1]